MDTLWTVVLGAIQGATEFLPVSSSGHLSFSKMLLADNDKMAALYDQPLMLEILLHLATLCTVMVVYRKELMLVVKGAISAVSSMIQRNLVASATKDDGLNLAVAIVVGTLPTAAIGLLIKDHVELVSSSPSGLGFCFLICAFLLFLTRFFVNKDKRLTWKTALIIGVAQGIAVFPGISRSGTTIAVALALGIKKEEAAKFSFLLSIPAIIGASIVELDFVRLGQSDAVAPLVLSAIAAFVIGLLAIITLLKILKQGRLWLFAPYLAIVGIASIFFLRST